MKDPSKRSATARRTPLRRAVRRTLGLLVVAGLLSLLILAILLGRDPSASFQARRGTLARVEREASLLSDGLLTERLSLHSSSGLRVRMAIKRPADAVPERRPLVLILGGHRTGRDAVELVEDTRGAVVAALSYPYEGAQSIKGWKILGALPRIRRAIADTPPALLLALDYLEAQAYVDPERTELVGVSLGAPFACISGGLDQRWERVWSIHGGGAPLRLLDHSLRRKIETPFLRWCATRSAYHLGYWPHLAPERWVGRIAPRELVMVNALADERIPRECVLTLFEAAGEPKRLQWLEGGHIEPDRKQLVAQLVDLVLDRVNADG